VQKDKRHTPVVDATNFKHPTMPQDASEKLHAIERFKRVDANTILDRVTVGDPSTFTKQWTMEFRFLSTPGAVLEYACHESNHALMDGMGGARKADPTKK